MSFQYRKSQATYSAGKIINNYLATARNANSTFSPDLADVSIKATLYSRARRSPSSLFTCRSFPQSALLPVANRRRRRMRNKVFVNSRVMRRSYLSMTEIWFPSLNDSVSPPVFISFTHPRALWRRPPGHTPGSRWATLLCCRTSLYWSRRRAGAELKIDEEKVISGSALNRQDSLIVQWHLMFV